MKQVKEVTLSHRANISSNTMKNRTIIEHYYKLGVEAAVAKASIDERKILKSRINRMESCNQFWTMETYESSRVKLLVRTFLCRDKFCMNCKRVKQFIMRKRFLSSMEKYRNSMYHVVLTVPNCTGEELSEIIDHMKTCFKTLVTYLNGNKKIKEVVMI